MKRTGTPARTGALDGLRHLHRDLTRYAGACKRVADEYEQMARNSDGWDDAAMRRALLDAGLQRIEQRRVLSWATDLQTLIDEQTHAPRGQDELEAGHLGRLTSVLTELQTIQFETSDDELAAALSAPIRATREACDHIKRARERSTCDR